jgi:uncharacterized coiled-coil DUF342 family protein
MKLTQAQRENLIALLKLETVSGSVERELDFLTALATETGELAELQAIANNEEASTTITTTTTVTDSAEDYDDKEMDEDNEEEESSSASENAAASAESENLVDPGAQVTTVDRAKALVSSRSKLTARNRELTQDLGATRSELAQVVQERDEALAKLSTLQSEREKLEATLSETEGKVKTLGDAVTDELAGLNVNEEELPDARAEGSSDIERITAAFQAEQSPEKKAELSRQIRELTK